MILFRAPMEFMRPSRLYYRWSTCEERERGATHIEDLLGFNGFFLDRRKHGYKTELVDHVLSWSRFKIIVSFSFRTSLDWIWYLCQNDLYIVGYFPYGLLALSTCPEWSASQIWKQSIPFFGDRQTTPECCLPNRFVPQSGFQALHTTQKTRKQIHVSASLTLTKQRFPDQVPLRLAAAGFLFLGDR